MKKTIFKILGILSCLSMILAFAGCQDPSIAATTATEDSTTTVDTRTNWEKTAFLRANPISTWPPTFSEKAWYGLWDGGLTEEDLNRDPHNIDGIFFVLFDTDGKALKYFSYIYPVQDIRDQDVYAGAEDEEDTLGPGYIYWVKIDENIITKLQAINFESVDGLVMDYDLLRSTD
ncbi:MAG: hypothetical protein K5839_05685 [Treponemataceae bacterium]|nr:hypothetical protein [Treponemataceae bacterium]